MAQLHVIRDRTRSTWEILLVIILDRRFFAMGKRNEREREREISVLYDQRVIG
jgi:hypothetical protein